MSFTSHNTNIRAIARKLLMLKSWHLGLLTSVFVSLLCSSQRPVNAVESVILQYHDTQMAISIASLKTFTQKRKMSSDLQVFFQQIPLSPKNTRQLLTDTIIHNRRFKLDQTNREFLAIQLNKLVGTPYGQEPTDALKMAMSSAIEDGNSFSILDVIEKYPAPKVRVELSRLEQVQSDVSQFRKRIQPLLGVANEILNDSLCDWEPIPTAPAKISSQAYSSKQRVFVGRLSAGLDAQVPGYLNEQNSTTAPTESDTLSQLKVIAKTEIRTISKSLIVASEKSLTSRANPNAPTSTSTAQQLIFTYGPFRKSLLIDELSVFAETGKLSGSLRSFLKLVKVNPENLRTLMTRETTVNLKVLDRVLNSIFGEYALFQVGQIIHTRSHQANIQALRAALIRSTSDDNRISLIEFLQNYPLQQVYVDGFKLSALMHNVKHAGGVSGFASQKISQVKDFLKDILSEVAAGCH